MSNVESKPVRKQGKKIRKNGQGSTSFDKARKKWVSEIDDFNGIRQKEPFDFEEDANQWRIKNFIARERGELLVSKNPKQTVSEFLVDWLEYRKPKIAPSTYRYYDITIRNRIVPYLGKTRAGKLKPEAIELYHCNNYFVSNGIKSREQSGSRNFSKVILRTPSPVNTSTEQRSKTIFRCSRPSVISCGAS